MSLNHFSHVHPLELSEMKINDDRFKCKACDKCCDGPTYSCKTCEFNLEKSCAELPRELRVPFHGHPLTLTVEPENLDSHLHTGRGGWFCCEACLHYRDGFSYCCQTCNVYVDVECASHLYLHQHGSEIFHMHVDNNKFHKSGHLLPSPLKYWHFNRPCDLVLCLGTDEYECKACGTSSQGPYYHCNRHHSKIGIKCALLQETMKSRGEPLFYHFSHGHPFMLKETSQDDEIRCAACIKYCSGQTYVCCSTKCKFSLHHSCFDLPQKVHHPFHPRHPLTLTKPMDFTTCNACFSFCYGFTYSCSACEFNLDVECPVISSTIEYQGHRHNLVFIQNVGRFIIRPDVPNKRGHMTTQQRIKCLACGNICTPSSSIFRCVECDSNLHLECGPLPCTIQHESLSQSLALANSPMVDFEGGDKLDSDLFYCDSCEKERDPRLPVYYFFDGCSYIAEIKCMMPEVLLSLTGECGEVELMNPTRHIAGKVIRRGMVKGIELQEAERSDIKAGKAKVKKTNNPKEKTNVKRALTLEQIVHFLTDEERKEFSSLYEAAQNDWPWKNNGSREQSSLLSEDDYAHFMKLLDDGKSNITMKLSGNNEKIVNVGEHSVTKYLAPILEDFIAKYGDITAESTLRSRKLKTYFTVRLCEIIHEMCNKRVADISKHDLFNWCINLKLLQVAGFKVEFTFDRFKRIFRAYHGVRLKQAVDEELAEIHREIAEVSLDVEKLKAELVAKKEKLELAKEELKGIESIKPAISSNVDDQCLKEASTLKWNTAGYGLL